MVQYNCIRCDYTTVQKNDFIRHLNRKNLCRPKLNDIDIIQVYIHNKMDVPESLIVENSKNGMNLDENGMNSDENDINSDKSIIVIEDKYQCKYCKKLFLKVEYLDKHFKLYCKMNNVNYNNIYNFNTRTFGKNIFKNRHEKVRYKN